MRRIRGGETQKAQEAQEAEANDHTILLVLLVLLVVLSFPRRLYEKNYQCRGVYFGSFGRRSLATTNGEGFVVGVSGEEWRSSRGRGRTKKHTRQHQDLCPGANRRSFQSAGLV